MYLSLYYVISVLLLQISFIFFCMSPSKRRRLIDIKVDLRIGIKEAERGQSNPCDIPNQKRQESSVKHTSNDRKHTTQLSTSRRVVAIASLLVSKDSDYNIINSQRRSDYAYLTFLSSMFQRKV